VVVDPGGQCTRQRLQGLIERRGGRCVHGDLSVATIWSCNLRRSTVDWQVEALQPANGLEFSLYVAPKRCPAYRPAPCCGASPEA
jgi:hypothetical protein